MTITLMHSGRTARFQPDCHPCAGVLDTALADAYDRGELSAEEAEAFDHLGIRIKGRRIPLQWMMAPTSMLDSK